MMEHLILCGKNAFDDIVNNMGGGICPPEENHIYELNGIRLLKATFLVPDEVWIVDDKRRILMPKDMRFNGLCVYVKEILENDVPRET